MVLNGPLVSTVPCAAFVQVNQDIEIARVGRLTQHRVIRKPGDKPALQRAGRIRHAEEPTGPITIRFPVESPRWA